MRCIVCLVLCSLFIGVQCYYPIICVAGIADREPHALEEACKQVAEKHPGTEVTFLYPGGFWGSFAPLWNQVERYRPIVDELFKKYPNGVHVAGHSQGTMITRALIETTPNHPVRNFISINGPFMGFYGGAGACSGAFNCFVRHVVRMIMLIVRKLILLKTGRTSLSMDDMDHDPTNEEKFLKGNFLPVINNLRPTVNTTTNKENFLRLKRFVMIGSSNDFIYHSSIGDFYDKDFKMVPLKQQTVYKSLGLDKMDEEDRLTRITIEGKGHLEIVTDINLFNEYVLKYFD